jgi:MFS family permease
MLMTLVTILLVDKVGRRRMLLWGTSVAGVSLIMVGILFSYDYQNSFYVWASFVFLVTYIAGYSASLGSLFWLVISEIYPLQIRSLAMSFVTAIQWCANLIVVLTFLSILSWIGPVYTFWMYALMCVLSFIFCYVAVPEASGISLEQIDANIRLAAKRVDATSLP